MQPFDDSVSCRVEEHLIGERVLSAAAELIDPVVEAEILEKATHRSELEMRVSVDETGKNYCIAEVVIFTVGRGGCFSDINDLAAIFHNTTVFHGRPSDRNYPARA